MRAGNLRRRVELQRNVPVQDGFGQMVESWETFAARRAAVEPVAGTERWLGDQRFAEIDVKFRMRWDRVVASTLTPLMRLRYDGRVFKILSVINVGERDREVHLMCKEEVA